MDLMWLLDLWNSQLVIAWWQMLLIGTAVVLANFVICVMLWFVRRESIIEYGYTKPNKNRRKKLLTKLKKQGFLDKVFLKSLLLEAERKGPFLVLKFVCNFLNIVSFFASLVGFWGCILTCADGWALTLLMFPVIIIMGITIAIEFIPDLVCLPSERKRYKWK